MRRPRLIVFSAVGLLLILALALIVCRSIRREQAQIRARYQQMRIALSSSDTNAVLALVAPQYRGGFDGYRFSMLNDFAEALGPRSSIVVLRDEAVVWPVRTSHYLVLPGGHTIGMIRVDGDWSFRRTRRECRGCNRCVPRAGR